MASSAYSLDEDKELLLSRSQDLNWVDDVTDFQCVGCDKVLIHHYIANCGHKFCLNCKKLLGDGIKRWRCPLKECNRFIEDIHLQDVFFEETVVELRAHCPNHKYGCPVIGPIKNIKDHLRKCVDTVENALPVLHDQNKGLDSAFVIKLLAKQNEKIESISLTLKDIRKTMEEERLSQERKWEEQEKKWEKINRKWKVYLKNYNKKMNQLEIETRQKMSQLSAEMSALNEKWKEMEVKESPAQEVFNSFIKPELQYLRRVSEYYKEKVDFTWIVSHVNSIHNENVGELESEMFPLTRYPFGARAKITLSCDSMYFCLSFKPLNESSVKKEIEIKPTPNVSFILKDQSKGKERKDFIKTTRFSYKTKFEFNKYYNIVVDCSKKSLVNSPLYTVDDKWAIDIHVEAPEVAQSVYSHDGTLTWAIDDFRKRKQMEVDGLIQCQLSPYFYTTAKGHRMQVHVYLNKWVDYKNKGVSIWVDYMNGVNDEDLEDSFDWKTTVTIFHPTRPHRNISKSQEYKSIFNHDWFCMGSETEIESFLLNDTLYYKVTVEVIKRKKK